MLPSPFPSSVCINLPDRSEYACSTDDDCRDTCPASVFFNARLHAAAVFRERVRARERASERARTCCVVAHAATRETPSGLALKSHTRGKAGSDWSSSAIFFSSTSHTDISPATEPSSSSLSDRFSQDNDDTGAAQQMVALLSVAGPVPGRSCTRTVASDEAEAIVLPAPEKLQQVYDYLDARKIEESKSKDEAIERAKKMAVSVSESVAHAAAPTTAEATEYLCLENMVDVKTLLSARERKELRYDIEDECGKCGKVVRVVVPTPSDEEVERKAASRAYVYFARVGSAESAHKVMHGRKFGGRIVQARYIEASEFEAFDKK